jgi:hypothetical protein
MNMKGDWFTNNIMGIVIAVIGLTIISFVAYKIWDINVNLEQRNVMKTMDIIEGKIDALNTGESTRVILKGFPGADNWYFTGWHTSEDRPDKCFLESCICLCKEGVGGDIFNCQESGYCRGVGSDSVIVERNSERENAKIHLKENLIEVEISKAIIINTDQEVVEINQCGMEAIGGVDCDE